MGRAPRCDKNELKKGPWTPEEDQNLIDYIQKHGPGSWRTLPKNAGLARCGKSCRFRWKNYLSPDIKRGRFSSEEEEIIIQLHSILGNRWSAIAARLPGRTDNEIKNYWKTRIRKRLLGMGIDPVTHSPRLVDLSSLLNLSLNNPNYQHDFSISLGLEPLVNSELVRLPTNLLSSQYQNINLVGQNLQEPQLPTPQVQDPFPSFQAHQLQNPIQDLEFPPCTTSNVQFLDECELMQANAEQFQPQAESNLWQDIVTQANLSENSVPTTSVSFDNLDPSIPQLISGNSNFLATNNPNHKLPSVLTTPASSPTQLNSSRTYVNGNTEDEKDSYCSSLFKFQIPDQFDVRAYM